MVEEGNILHHVKRQKLSGGCPGEYVWGMYSGGNVWISNNQAPLGSAGSSGWRECGESARPAQLCRRYVN